MGTNFDDEYRIWGPDAGKMIKNLKEDIRQLREQIKELEQYQLDCKCADLVVENDELRRLLKKIHEEISSGTTQADEAYILGRIEALIGEV